MLGCGIETEAVAPSVNPSELISYLEPEFRTYNLSTVAPYDTVTLKIRGVSGAGTTLDLPVSFAYDTQYVAITSDGILQAKSVVTNTPVVVSMSNNGATRYDTLRVSVIGTLPRHLARVAIEPAVGDSAKITMLLNARAPRKSLLLIRNDSSNAPVTSVLVWIQSSNTGVASVAQSANTVSVTPRAPGRTMLRISTFAYGAGFRDSLAFITGWPLLSYVLLTESFITGRLTPVLSLNGTRNIIGLGGCIVWRNVNPDLETDLVFDDPSVALPGDSATEITRTACQLTNVVYPTAEGSGIGGNIPAFHLRFGDNGMPIDGSRIRAFTKPGIITYRSPIYNFVGTIVVCDERNDLTCAPEHYQWGIPER